MKKIIYIVAVLLVTAQGLFALDLDGQQYVIPPEFEVEESSLKPLYSDYNWKEKFNDVVEQVYGLVSTQINSPDQAGYRFMKYLLALQADEFQVYSNVQIPVKPGDDDRLLSKALLQHIAGRVLSNQELTLMMIFRQDNIFGMPMDKDMFDLEKIYTRQHANGIYDLIYEDAFNEGVRAGQIEEKLKEQNKNSSLDILSTRMPDPNISFRLSELMSYSEPDDNSFVVGIKADEILETVMNNISNLVEVDESALQNPMLMMAVVKAKNLKLMNHTLLSPDGYIYRVYLVRYLPVN